MVQHNDVVKTQSKTIAQSNKSSYGEISEICLKLTLKTELLMLTLNRYLLTRYPENIYVFKAIETQEKSEICSKLTILIPERRHLSLLLLRTSSTSFPEQISQIVLVFLLLTLKK